MRVENNIQPLFLKLSCLPRKKIFRLKPNSYKLFVLITFLCVKEK